VEREPVGALVTAGGSHRRRLGWDGVAIQPYPATAQLVRHAIWVQRQKAAHAIAEWIVCAPTAARSDLRGHGEQHTVLAVQEHELEGWIAFPALPGSGRLCPGRDDRLCSQRASRGCGGGVRSVATSQVFRKGASGADAGGSTPGMS
jgi:hypothetical protein